MKYITPIVLAVGLAMSAGAPALAMTDSEMVSMGQSMLTGALYNSLRAQSFPTDGIEKLTLGEVALLNSLLNSSDGAAERSGQINLIFERANER